ncbi:hypothetical protein D9M68_860230 [compost metagenome]
MRPCSIRKLELPPLKTAIFRRAGLDFGTRPRIAASASTVLSRVFSNGSADATSSWAEYMASMVAMASRCWRIRGSPAFTSAATAG